MKVYVTQGHEKGIGLEVFFKSCLMMKKSDIGFLKLIAFKNSVSETLKLLNLPFTITKNSLELPGLSLEAEWCDEVSHSESFTALKKGMERAESDGILFTLPTSKDQFPGFPGHTEYFRSFYNRPELGMFFSSPKLRVLLLSDHVAIRDLSESMTEELIYSRLKAAVTTLKSWAWPTQRILVSGLNPHAGENGLIGQEDKRITQAIKRLASETKIDMSGPYPGDTMLLEQKASSDLLVYLFHDQGLGVFKGLQGFVGSNITLGLPYPRFSPDHGTSLSLFGKNQADFRGCAYALKEALELLKRKSYGQNSGHQS